MPYILSSLQLSQTFAFFLLFFFTRFPTCLFYLPSCQALTSLKSLCKLDLQDNTFSEKAGVQLANSIREQVLPSIQRAWVTLKPFIIFSVSVSLILPLSNSHATLFYNNHHLLSHLPPLNCLYPLWNFLKPLLVHLNLRDAGLGEEGTSAVISALKQGKQNLEFLDLSGMYSKYCLGEQFSFIKISCQAFEDDVLFNKFLSTFFDYSLCPITCR